MQIPKISALYESSLASALSAAGSSFTVVSATDRDGNALSGLYGFIIDEGTADEEFVIGTVTGTSVAIAYRGIDADAPNTEVAGNKKAHRRGASVKITDYPIMGVLRNILNGDDTLPNAISYASHPTFTTNTQLVDKQYVDGVTTAGAPDSSNTTKGITKLSVAAASPTSPIAVGDNDPRVPTQGENDALVGNNTDIAVGTGNKFMTQTGAQSSVENYAVTTGSSNAYVAALSPVPTTLVAGFTIRIKANFTNTGSATINVNSLGVKTIKKIDGATNLSSGDIVSGQIYQLIYDGTNFILISPFGSAQAFKNGTTTYGANTASSSQTIPHGLGAIPKYVRLTAFTDANSTSTFLVNALAVYNGTTVSGITQAFSVNTSPANAVISTQSSLLVGNGTNNQNGVITVDATNITITWTKNGTGVPMASANFPLLWEANT